MCIIVQKTRKTSPNKISWVVTCKNLKTYLWIASTELKPQKLCTQERQQFLYSPYVSVAAEPFPPPICMNVYSKTFKFYYPKKFVGDYSQLVFKMYKSNALKFVFSSLIVLNFNNKKQGPIHPHIEDHCSKYTSNGTKRQKTLTEINSIWYFPLKIFTRIITQHHWYSSLYQNCWAFMVLII